VKRQIPGREPRVLPLVGHREHVVVVDVNPGPVAAQEPLGWWRRHRRIALQPLFHHVVIELFAPQQAGESLALHHARVVGQAEGREAIKILRFLDAIQKHLMKIGLRRGARVQTEVQNFRSARLQIQAIHPAGLGARFIGIHRILASLDQVAVEGILVIQPAVVTPHSHGVALVFGEQQRRGIFQPQLELAERLLLDADGVRIYS